MELSRAFWRTAGLCVLCTLAIVASHSNNRGEYELTTQLASRESSQVCQHKNSVVSDLCKVLTRKLIPLYGEPGEPTNYCFSRYDTVHLTQLDIQQIGTTRDINQHLGFIRQPSLLGLYIAACFPLYCVFNQPFYENKRWSSHVFTLPCCHLLLVMLMNTCSPLVERDRLVL